MLNWAKSAVLLLRLSKSLSSIQVSLAKLAETQELLLKLQCIEKNLMLSDLKEATEEKDGEFESTYLAQSSDQMAKITDMFAKYKEVVGREPASDATLDEIERDSKQEPQ